MSPFVKVVVGTSVYNTRFGSFSCAVQKIGVMSGQMRIDRLNSSPLREHESALLTVK
jgi:hypothetical protein